jgi:hypothetical protein
MMFSMVLCLIVANGLSKSALAAIPSLISYQGRLTTATGEPVADGGYFIRFQIFDAPAAGTSLWNSGIQAVPVTNGTYTYVLGQDVPFPNGLFTGGNRWLGITVGADPELTPRQQMIATGYAFVSQNADSVNWSGIKNLPAGFADGVDDNSGDITAVNTSSGLTGGVATGDANISIANGGVTSAHIGDGQVVNADISADANIAASKIVGTAAILAGTQAFSGANTFNSLVTFGDSTMRVDNTGISMGGTHLPNSANLLDLTRNVDTPSARYGVRAYLSNSGVGKVNGLFGKAESSTAGAVNAGQAYGVVGEAYSDNNTRVGVYGFAQSFSPALTTGTSYGVYGITNSSASNQVGVYGTTHTDGPSRAGVWGNVEGGSSNADGLRGTAAGVADNGYALRAKASYCTQGIGGIFEVVNNVDRAWGAEISCSNNGDDTRGILVTCSGNLGSPHYAIHSRVIGNNGTAYAIFTEAYNNGTNWAGYFSGDVTVTGTIFTPVMISRIDHPQDPENQFLQHAAVQSPEMTNQYSGNVITNAVGDADVILPDYFSTIITDVRYQLTVVGEFAQAIVTRKVEGNRFSIKTDKPNVEVSWLIIGSRIDPSASRSKFATEVAKPADAVGQYLNPEVYGLGRERSIGYQNASEISSRPVASPKDKK